MVEQQIVRRGVTNSRVLDAMRSVPRHNFVPADLQDDAYADYPLPIGHGQTISQPYIVALMSALLTLEGHEKMLEVGTGSGYQAAILSLLAASVDSVELIPELAENARETLQNLGYGNVTIHEADGSLGWPENAPYDAILVTAAAPQVPRPLLDQLTPQGRMVLPVGGSGFQTLELWTQENNVWQPQEILPVAFVPLRGQHGWK